MSSRLAEFAAAAARLAAAGNLLPGPAAADSFNDFAFALPGGAKETYLDLKFPLVAARLADLAPLCEIELCRTGIAPLRFRMLLRGSARFSITVRPCS